MGSTKKIFLSASLAILLVCYFLFKPHAVDIEVARIKQLEGMKAMQAMQIAKKPAAMPEVPIAKDHPITVDVKAKVLPPARVISSVPAVSRAPNPEVTAKVEDEEPEQKDSQASGVYLYLPVNKGFTVRVSVLQGKEKMLRNLVHAGASKSCRLSLQTKLSESKVVRCESEDCQHLIVDASDASNDDVIGVYLDNQSPDLELNLNEISVPQVYLTYDGTSNDARNYHGRIFQSVAPNP